MVLGQGLKPSDPRETVVFWRVTVSPLGFSFHDPVEGHALAEQPEKTLAANPCWVLPELPAYFSSVKRIWKDVWEVNKKKNIWTIKKEK